MMTDGQNDTDDVEECLVMEKDDHIDDIPVVHVTSKESSILKIIRKTQTKIQRRRDMTSSSDARQSLLGGNSSGLSGAGGIPGLPSSAAAVRAQRAKVKKYNLVSRDRLKIPTKNREGRYLSDLNTATYDQSQPLVPVPHSGGESDEEFDSQVVKKMSNKEIKEQLMKDGYNLDLQSDDEDLDLIPPRPMSERCVCCNYQITCSIL